LNKFRNLMVKNLEKTLIFIFLKYKFTKKKNTVLDKP
jgi:hypothetical protein